MDKTKLVGARKRKPVAISKIPMTTDPDLDEEMFTLPHTASSTCPGEFLDDHNKSKLESILVELKLKKSLQQPRTAPHPHHPHPLIPQTEPLDLSMDAVDLSKGKPTVSMTTVATPENLTQTNQMMLFYQQYFLNGGSTAVNSRQGDRVGLQNPMECVEVRLGEEQILRGGAGGGPGGVPEKCCKKKEGFIERGVVSGRRLQNKLMSQVVHCGGDYNDGDKKTKDSSHPNKPKQRRYRTERPFACPHCPARFTLRSNMERHGKHQHPLVWQRSPSNRVLNKQKLLSCQPSTPPHHSPLSLEREDSVRAVLCSKLKRKLSENEELASVDKLLRLVGGGGGLRLGLNSREEDTGEDMEDEGEEFEEEGEESGSGFEEEEEEEEEENNKKLSKKQSAYSSAPHKISCPHCSRRFPWSSSLRRHLLTHTGQKPFQCSKCPLLFTTKSNCDRHLVRKHKHGHGHHDNATTSEEEEEEGEEGEEEEEGLITMTTNNEPMFRCHICDNSESSTPIQSTCRNIVLVHMETAHPEIYEEFKEKNLILDEEGVSNCENGSDHGNRKVLCVFCLRRFWSVEDLRRHIRSHTGERPFSCKFCKRRFTLKHSMMRHEKKH